MSAVPPVPALRRVLVANRGEIAVRIVRACHDLGLEAVVAHSEVDRDSLAVRMADRAVCVGPGPASASYLNGPAMIAAATALGADAIHPGYGFLSENATFAAACEAAGVRFVGPRPRAVELMGDKVEARRVAASVGVPLVPGSDGPVSASDARRVADAVGYPLIVKAAGGGGGRGMRLARDGAELDGVVSSAAAEARSAFGNGAVYLERFIADARHVEIQVAFDEHGTGVHLGERDCSVQRRYQKLVEESPSPAVDDSTRGAMAEAALALCRAVEYRGLGTVEFLLDGASGDFHFIEMNTRLQVEHPVTELVAGIDLVALQLRIAAGDRIGFEQASVTARGHAIEFRLNAEDPEAGFRPSAGTLERWAPPLGPGVRVDTHCFAGYRVPPFYDSLLAKIVVWGADRTEALSRSRRALAELDVAGVATTRPFHAWLLGREEFVAGQVSTTWAERAWADS